MHPLTYDRFVPLAEYRYGADPEDPKAITIMRMIERVPDQIQKIMSDRGGRLIFCNGPLTNNPEIEHEKGRRPQGWSSGTWEESVAGFSPSFRTAFFGLKGQYRPTTVLDVGLHEYGHMCDDLVGKYFFEQSLSKHATALDVLGRHPFSDKYYNHQREYVAHAFEHYYYGFFRRLRLRMGVRHAMYKLFRDIEERAAAEVSV